MILFIEIGVTTLRFIFFEFLITYRKQVTIFLRGHTRIKIAAAGDITGKSKYLHACLHNRVDDTGDLHAVCFGNRRHHNATDPGTVDTADLFKRAVVGAGLAEPVVCFTQAVDRQLIFLTAICFQFTADLIVQVEWISEDGKRYAVFVEQFQKPPKIRVQDRIAARDVEIGQTVINLAKVKAIIKSVLHLLKVHRIDLFTGISQKNVTVLAPLIAFICNVPLKSKILLHFAYLTSSCLYRSV